MNKPGLEYHAIYVQFHPRIQRYLARMVGDFEAEDLTQDVFIRVIQALPAFRGESKLSTWIYRIATNAALDRLRAPSFKRILENQCVDESETAETENVDLDGWIGGEAASPEYKLWRKQGYECYRDKIENLPVNYRTVVALSELEDMTAGEIAEILGLSVDVVKIRLHRGRMKLLRELKAHCKAEDWL